VTGLIRGRDVSGAVRFARPAELETLTEALFRGGLRPGPDLDPEVPTVVFCYPGLGVGERACALSGCTNQLVLLDQARARAGRLGIRVLGASTEPSERHAHLRNLDGVIACVSAADAVRLPHVTLDGEPYLLRRTVVVGGPLRGLVVESIEDSVAHTSAMLDALGDDGQER
jgi:hypothetical protein